LSLSLGLGYALIFFARLADVSLATLRTLMVVRGSKLQAAAVGFVEVLIYITALGVVVRNLESPVHLIVYALGFASGNFIGTYLEERLALGFATVHVIPRIEMAGALAEELRAMGFGVTVMRGQGRYGPRDMLFISLRRRMLARALKHLQERDPSAFVTVLETRRTRGGVFGVRKGK